MKKPLNRWWIAAMGAFATVAKWFPDRKGLVPGLVVMGFGFGALAMSKVIAPALESVFGNRLPPVFAGAGLIVGGLCVFWRKMSENAWTTCWTQ